MERYGKKTGGLQKRKWGGGMKRKLTLGGKFVLKADVVTRLSTQKEERKGGGNYQALKGKKLQ